MLPCIIGLFQVFPSCASHAAKILLKLCEPMCLNRWISFFNIWSKVMFFIVCEIPASKVRSGFAYYEDIQRKLGGALSKW